MKIFIRERKVSNRYTKTRKQLRELAKKHGVKRGRNTDDTVKKLKDAGIYWN